TPPAPEPSPTDLLKKQTASLSLQIAKLQADISALKGGGAS
ncbi:phage protein, partial [Bacillus glycinifermentans]